MSTFKDTKGNDWSLVLDYSMCRRVEDGLGIPVLSDVKNVEFNIETVVQLAWTMIEDQADRIGVTPEDFGGSLTGDSIGDLTAAVIEAVAVFYQGHSPPMAAVLRRMVAMMGLVGQQLDKTLGLLSDSQSYELLDSLVSALVDSQPGNSEKCSKESSPTPQAMDEAVPEDNASLSP